MPRDNIAPRVDKCVRKRYSDNIKVFNIGDVNMKKYISLLLSLIFVISLGACNGLGQEDDGKALETADSYIDMQNNSGSIDLTEDTAKTLLGVYGSEKLGLEKDISEYNLKLSAAKYNEVDGCKVEAFLEKAETVEGTFMIVGSTCYVYDKTQMKYIPLSNIASKGNTSTTASDETSGTTALNIPDDPEITFQYHKENNYLMRQRFAQYDIAKLGLSKAVSEYVFIVNGNSGYALDGTKIYYVDVYEKNGDSIGVRLGFAENGEYAYNPDADIYTKLEK